MRKIALLISALVLFCLPVKAQEAADSTVFPKLDTLLARYTAAIERESVDVKKAESDFLISSVKDSLTTQHIALWLYDHYKESALMGDEAVAIHIFDSWFKPGTVKMRGEFDFFDAELFATFNRSTLLGMKAPVVEMKGPCGCKVTLPQEGTYSILFFYDTACAKCKLESQLMPGILEANARHTGKNHFPHQDVRRLLRTGQKGLEAVAPLFQSAQQEPEDSARLGSGNRDRVPAALRRDFNSEAVFH